jgi:hypothetical protein
MQSGPANDAWISKITMNANLSINHICQFVSLWTILRHVTLSGDVKDEITWTLSESGQCMADYRHKL